MEELDACKDKLALFENLGSWKSYDLGGAIARFEEHGRDWRSMDEIGGAVRRMEELDACKDKQALVVNLVFLKSYDLGGAIAKLGGARTRLEELI